jgi:hypothetical protein
MFSIMRILDRQADGAGVFLRQSLQKLQGCSCAGPEDAERINIRPTQPAAAAPWWCAREAPAKDCNARIASWSRLAKQRSVPAFTMTTVALAAFP